MQKRAILNYAGKAGAVAIITLQAFSPVFAVTGSGSAGSNGAQLTLAAQRQQTREQICTATQSSVQSRIQTRQTILNEFTVRYTNLSQRLSNIISLVSTKYPDIDLTNLQADAVKLQTMYNAALSESNQAYNAFGNINFANCLNGSGEFKSEYGEARTQAKIALEAHNAYWNFVKTTLKADLESLRTQINNLTVAE